MKARRLSESLKLLGEINEIALRVYDDNGNFDYASFMLGDIEYIMDLDGELYKHYNNDVTPVNVSWCKSGIYPQITIKGLAIKSYVLTMVLTDKSFYDKYISNSSLVVNHTVTTYKVESHGYFNSYRSVIIPEKSVAYNPRYIEVVTNSENIRHGKFVDRFELYGVYVSAKDLDDLEPLLRDPWLYGEEYHDAIVENNIKAVLEYYSYLHIDLQPA